MEPSRILVIDDEPVICDGCRLPLSDQGFVVATGLKYCIPFYIPLSGDKPKVRHQLHQTNPQYPLPNTRYPIPSFQYPIPSNYL